MKKYFLMILVLLFIGITSATITVTLPVEAPNNINATLYPGGNLAPNHTYYYTVFEQWNDLNGYSTSYAPYKDPQTIITNYNSPLSEENNFTTNDTHRSAYIQWNDTNIGLTNVYYQILLSNESGDYTNSGGYDTALETVGNIQTKYYNITEENNGVYVIHSANLVRNLSYGINKDLGTIRVDVDGGTYSDLVNSIYNEAVSSGYEDYFYYDGYHFAIKGWINFEGTSTTEAYVRRKDVTFVKGGLYMNNVNADLYFGEWLDDYTKADYTYGTNINIQNARYPFKARGEGQLHVSGSRVTASNTDGLMDGTNILSDSYYDGGGALYLSSYIEGIRDDILSLYIRSVSSEVKDLKTGIGNNWHWTDSHRLIITHNRWNCYLYECKIYDTTWTESMIGSNAFHQYIPASGNSYSTWVFNPIFSQLPETNKPEEWYFATNYGTLVSDTYWQVFNSVNAEVLDSNGNPISGVTMNGTDANGNPAKWFEHYDDIDRKVTGNTFLGNVTTDENGTIDTYYLVSYNVTINQSNDIADVNCDNFNMTNFYPYTFTFSKEGYKDYTVKLLELTTETNLLVTLEEQTGGGGGGNTVIYSAATELNIEEEYPYLNYEISQESDTTKGLLISPYIIDKEK